MSILNSVSFGLDRKLPVILQSETADCGLVCLAMIYGLGWTNWLRLGVWLVLGLIIYFVYGKQNSKLNNPDK